MADLLICQTPTHVNLECDRCEEEFNIDYKEFMEEYGLFDWIGKKVKCPYCGYKNYVDNWEFD